MRYQADRNLCGVKRTSKHLCVKKNQWPVADSYSLSLCNLGHLSLVGSGVYVVFPLASG